MPSLGVRSPCHNIFLHLSFQGESRRDLTSEFEEAEDLRGKNKKERNAFSRVGHQASFTPHFGMKITGH